MSQSDLNIANVSRSLFRQEANEAFQALGSLSSGATEPTTTYAYQLWADTASGLLKQRNAANDGWINKGNLSEVDWGLLNKGGGTMTGLLNLAAGADIASASTVDLTAATGNCPKITGTTAVTAWTMNTGQQMKCIADGALPLTYHATTNNIEGGASYTCTAGDIINLVKGLDGVVRVRIDKQDGTAVVSSTTYASEAEYISGTETAKALSPAVARDANIVLDTLKTTSGSASYDFTGIPSWVKRITVMFSSISTNGSSDCLIQLGDSGGIEPTGYGAVAWAALNAGANAVASFTTGFPVGNSAGATLTRTGTMTLTLMDASTNTWAMSSNINYGGTVLMSAASGVKSLSATLDKLRLTTVNGTDAFDGGSVNIQYE